VKRTSQLGNRVSTVLGRKLGQELLHLRLTAGKTQQQAADVINATNSKIVKMESGWVPMRDPDIRILCESYEVHDPKVVGWLLELARLDRERRKAKGWWISTTTAAMQVEYLSMEDAAFGIRQWQMALVPGLFQTPGYLRAMGTADLSWNGEGQIEELVARRLKRQERLHSAEPLRIHTVIWEAALRHQMGGPQVMSEQLTHLCRLAELPNVRIQVLPFDAGQHPCVGGPFSILSFGETEALDLTYVETPRSLIWIENPEESASFVTLFDRAVGAALSPHDSVQFINAIIKEIGT
jgi:DNA-binding XRE family transcriptional regulator